jgi:hypothetical protein
MAEMILTVVCSVLASTGLWKLLDSVIARKASRKTAETAALIALLHAQLYERCKKAINSGEITISEYDDLQHIAEAYFELGGNGTGKMLIEETKKLKKITGSSRCDLAISTYYERHEEV